jgi:aldehyde dehydrogenase (NAD+)
VRIHDDLYIGGAWQRPRTDRVIDVYSPATESVVGRVPAASPADVDAAVAVARAALDGGDWAWLAPKERGALLGRLAKNLRARTGELAQLICEEVGSPRAWAVDAQVMSAVGVFNVHRNLAETYPWVETRPAAAGGTVRVRRVPVGVVGAIVPWNAPLFTAALKIAPALLAGCSVVLKPSPEAPLSAFVLAEAATEAGFPDGVLSVLPGGIDTSEHLVRHADIDKISFTGSTIVGRRIAEICGHDLRRCTLELGGKSPAVLLDDVELTERVVAQLVTGAMAGSGQVCAAQTRILAPRCRYSEVVDALGEAVAALRVGDPSDDATEIGPVISGTALQRIEKHIDAALGTARLIAGGRRPPYLRVGHYLEPTLFADVDPASPVARDEIFGPVAVVIGYDDEDDAVRIANDTDYGLAGSVWTADPTRGENFAGRLVAGSIAVNSSAPLDLGSPFGGMRASGLGRECGPEGVSGFVEHQSIILASA